MWVIRQSTSAGIRHADTGKEFKGSGGLHLYLRVENGADVDRFLRTLHNLCWLHGFGWHIVSKSGQLLERSIVDRYVGSPERLVFEGSPVLEGPLIASEPRPEVIEGDTINTLDVWPAANSRPERTA